MFEYIERGFSLILLHIIAHVPSYIHFDYMNHRILSVYVMYIANYIRMPVEKKMLLMKFKLSMM